MYQLIYTKQAQKDSKKLVKHSLKDEAQKLLDVLKIDPLKNPPPYKKLIGDLTGAFSRRINFQHRLVYQVIEELKTVKVIRMWSHYDLY